MNTEAKSSRIQLDDWLNPMSIQAFFPQDRPLEIDMGCGKGRFLLARAQRNPDANFLGIDRLLGRLRRIDRRVQRAGLDNVRLLRMDAHYATRYLLPTHAVDTYYVFFPDPWPKRRHHKNRLFDEDYLDALIRTLKPGGCVHFATDHLPYFDTVKRALQEDQRFAETETFTPTPEEQTDFELLFIETKPIGRCSYRKI